MHTFTAESDMQCMHGAGALLRDRDREELGIELATFGLPANRPYPVSLMPP